MLILPSCMGTLMELHCACDIQNAGSIGDLSSGGIMHKN